MPSTEDVLASKSRLGDGTCSRRHFCLNWKTSELFGSAVPPLGREGAGSYPKVLFVLMDLSLMAENLQCLVDSSGHGDCGIKSEVSLGLRHSWALCAWKRRFHMTDPLKLYSVVPG